jgi:hypothetical protein
MKVNSTPVKVISIMEAHTMKKSNCDQESLR